jgi:hypothetical protein
MAQFVKLQSIGCWERPRAARHLRHGRPAEPGERLRRTSASATPSSRARSRAELLGGAHASRGSRWSCPRARCTPFGRFELPVEPGWICARWPPWSGRPGWPGGDAYCLALLSDGHSVVPARGSGSARHVPLRTTYCRRATSSRRSSRLKRFLRATAAAQGALAWPAGRSASPHRWRPPEHVVRAQTGRAYLRGGPRRGRLTEPTSRARAARPRLPALVAACTTSCRLRHPGGACRRAGSPRPGFGALDHDASARSATTPTSSATPPASRPSAVRLGPARRVARLRRRSCSVERRRRALRGLLGFPARPPPRRRSSGGCGPRRSTAPTPATPFVRLASGPRGSPGLRGQLSVGAGGLLRRQASGAWSRAKAA